jgi:hypothetical protein
MNPRSIKIEGATIADLSAKRRFFGDPTAEKSYKRSIEETTMHGMQVFGRKAELLCMNVDPNL